MSALSTPGHARSRPYAAFALLVLAAMHLQSAAFSLQCTIGAARCVKSQGTEIPSKRAIEVLELCDDFTKNDLGRVAMRLSYKEMNDRTGGKLTPLALAWHAYGDLIDSPLKFERKARAEDAKYEQIKRACVQLERDFNDESKWTK